MKLTTKNLVLSALMIAIAVILSMPMFKINGSIGFDALPAFFAAAAIGPVLGGIVGAIAHILTAILTGFPFGPPLHLVVMVFMFVSCFGYGFIRSKVNRYAAVVTGIVLNAPVSLFVTAMIAAVIGAPFAGIPMFIALIGPLTLASAINVILAEVIFTATGKYVNAD